MLTVTKQAATEAECDAILNASLQVDKPFSVPVLFLNPDDYAPRKFCGFNLYSGAEKTLRHKIENFAANCAAPDPAALKDLEGRDYDTRPVGTIASTLAGILKGHYRYNDDYIACAQPVLSPRFSIAVCTVTGSAVKPWAAKFIGQDTPQPDYPGHDSQYHFISLWHEFAHSVAGDNEAGAELTAAVACRHAFADCNFLQVQADLRVADAVLKYEKPDTLKNYGWACVEAVEAAIALETTPDAETLRNVGENSWRAPRIDRSASISDVAVRLHIEVGDQGWHETRRLDRLADLADRLIEQNAFDTPEKRMIASRFALAARRLSIGTPAYQQPATVTPDRPNPLRSFLREFI